LARIIENPQQLILSKAKEILYNEGYMNLTMRNVSKACNIALGTIYNYYPTKKDLVIEMMTEYWHGYINKTQDIVNSDNTFYDKLKIIFDDLSIFLKTFKEIWLKPELYDKADYVKDGIERKSLYIGKLILLIEAILIKHNKVKNNLSSYETAEFIVLNFITIVQMPVFKYPSFEVILKELLN
jgi:AcrR family transcriptional regulator